MMLKTYWKYRSPEESGTRHLLPAAAPYPAWFCVSHSLGSRFIPIHTLLGKEDHNQGQEKYRQQMGPSTKD